MSTNWDQRFLKLAEHISGWSKDPSTKVGCVVVGEDREIRSTGFNGFPRGIEDTELRYNDRELKYKYVVHAETNCIYNAAFNGNSLDGCTMYVWPLPVCHECAKAIIQSGVCRVVSPQFTNPETELRWKDSCAQTIDMFDEAYVQYDFI